MASFTICNEQSAEDIENRVRQIYTIIEKYRGIIEAYLSDFYTKDHWSLLPLSWQHYLEQLDFAHLSKLLKGQPWCHPTLHSSVSPLSLLALRACCEHLSLNRHCVDMDSANTVASVEHVLCCPTNESSSSSTPHSSVVFTETSTGKTLSFKNGQLMDMQHIFRKHVKPKKQHEIQQLGKVINMVGQQAATNHIVDVGAGLGHLSRLLTFAYGLKVTTVEATGGHAPKANKLADDAEAKDALTLFFESIALRKKAKARQADVDKLEKEISKEMECLKDALELEKDVQKKLKMFQKNEQMAAVLSPPTDLPSHVVCTVQPDITTDDFLRLVFSTDSGSDDSRSRSDLNNSSADAASAPLGSQKRSVETMELGRPATLSTLQCSASIKLESAQDLGAAALHVDGVRSAGEPGSVSLSCQEDNGDTVQWSGESAAKISKYDADEEGDVISEDSQNKSTESQLQHSQSLASSRTITPTDKITKSTPNSVTKPNPPVSHQNQDASQALEENSLNKSIEQNDQNHHPRVQSRGEASTEKLASKGDDAGSTCDSEVGRTDRGQRSDRFVLAGLHACGDLTTTLLRVFVNCPAVSALVSVACCYRKLSAYSCHDDKHSEKGYPMSQFVRSLQSHPLTYEAREMACHFVDAYAQRLIDGPPHLKIHSYRAALQYVVTQIRPDFALGLTRLVVKRGAEIPFPQYAEQCLQRLGIDPTEVPSATMATAESLTSSWRQVVAFYTLRLSLAPLVETAMLLDRMLFLHEQSLHSVLLPVFDSSLSPRNFALLSCKPSSAAGR